jgi:uncharacterized repeat protein (TIGR03803 family)
MWAGRHFSRSLAAACTLLASTAASAASFRTLHVFRNEDVAPNSQLLEVGDAIYGTTQFGGAKKRGSVFRIDLRTNTETTLYSFGGGKDGETPQGGLAYADGILYGTTGSGGDHSNCQGGCGTIFAIDLGTGELSVLYRFRGGSDGAGPSGDLIIHRGAKGGRGDIIHRGTKLFGTTQIGGQGDCGTVFAVDVASGKEAVLHAFSGGADGQTPLGGITFGNDVLYGTTLQGGESENGIVFSVDPSGSGYSILHTFTGVPDGANSRSGTIYTAGTLLGATVYGGRGRHENPGYGTVFSIDTSTNAESILYAFPASLPGGAAHGFWPIGDLVLQNANLFGAAVQGGRDANGAVFSLDLATGQERLIHSFKGGSDGADPAGLTPGADGVIFGVTAFTVFEITP